jgi:hypothetical protein
MKKHLILLVFLAATLSAAHAGELQKDYFMATPPGAWAEYRMEIADGTKFQSTSQRNADENGRIILEEAIKFQAGAGKGTESKTTYVLPQNFNIGKDWLSYGKFTEKMSMKTAGIEMPVDPTTLEAIKKGSKDYRGAVAFETTENIDGHICDRYAYSIAIAGPTPSKETGQIWLDATVPFGIVRQAARVMNADGSVASSFETRLIDTGRVQLDTIASAKAAPPAVPAAPAVVSLLEGYTAGRIGIEVSVGSNGQPLQLTFINKTDTPLTVTLKKGPLDIPASEPVSALKIIVRSNARIAVPAGAFSEAITVDQQPGRGALEGKFELSVYEGTKLYSGSVTRGTVSGR